MDDNSFEKIDALLKERPYEELSSEEKFFVDQQIGGKQKYELLRELILQAKNELVHRTNPATKQALLNQFKKKHQFGLMRVLEVKIPAYWVMALLVLGIALSILFASEKNVVVEKIVYTPGKTITDTLIVTQFDTVFSEKVVEKTIYLTKAAEEENPQIIPSKTSIKSKSLAEQGELKTFLVESD